MDRNQKVTALIASGMWDESQREFLTALEETAFGAIETSVLKANEAKGLAQENATLKANAAKKPATVEEFLSGAPAEIAVTLRAGMQQLADKRTGLIATIKANTANKLNDAQLGAMGLDVLESIASTLAAVTPVDPVADYSTRGVPTPAVKANADGSGVPAMPKPDFTKK